MTDALLNKRYKVRGFIGKGGKPVKVTVPIDGKPCDLDITEAVIIEGVTDNPSETEIKAILPHRVLHINSGTIDEGRVEVGDGDNLFSDLGD